MPPINYRLNCFPPKKNIDWHALMPKLAPAAAAVARFDSLLSTIPEPHILLTQLATREAVLSSRIEGIKATLEEVMQFEAGIEPSSTIKRYDILEILNYRRAMRTAEEELHIVPLSQRVIKGTSQNPYFSK